MVFLARMLFLSVPLLTMAAAAAAATAVDAAGDPLADRILAYLEALEANYNVSGTVSVSIAGTELVHQQIGVAFAQDSDPKPNGETQYRIGSITKMFTAVMIFQLVEEGQLTLTTLLSDFFPNIPNADTITIELMLRHMSGIDNFTEDPDYFKYDLEPQTKEDMLARIEAFPSDFEPGTQTEYSNTNYLLLGYIIEDVTGNSYADELNNRIATETNSSLTRTAYMTPASVEQNVALSFDWDTNGQQWNPRPETDPSIPHGAGAIMSTASELNVFVQSLFAFQLINETSLETMTKVNEQGFGMGVFPIPYNTLVGLGHDGAIDGFQSILMYFPEEKVALSVISNGSDYSDDSIAFNDVLIELLNIVFTSDDSGVPPEGNESTSEDSGVPPEGDESTSGQEESSVFHSSIMFESFLLLSTWGMLLCN